MSYSPSSPITGSAQTGFTSPTYTIAPDTAPDYNGKQHAVTAIGGTQAGVTVHTPGSPFTLTFVRPKSLRMLPPLGINGQYPNVPNNVYKFIVRKGVTPAANQPARVAMAEMSISVPAGSETYDAANVRALLSACVGLLNQQSAGIGDTVVTSIV